MKCYIVEKEKGKEKEVLLGEFFDDLVRQNKGFNENTKLYFLQKT